MGVALGTTMNRWTKEECETLLALRDQGVAYEDIARSLGRSVVACTTKAFQLGASYSATGKSAMPDSIEEMARKNYDIVAAQLDALEERRSALLSEKSKAMKVLVALGLEDEQHMCTKCGQEFVRKGDLTAHVNREHPTTVHVGEGVVSQ